MQPVMHMFRNLLWVLIISLGLFSCNYPGFANLNTTPSPTVTLPPPTSTPIPLAANVNGEGITFEVFEAEISRFEQEQTRIGIDLATIPDYREQVLWALIDLKLLAQGAEEAGFEGDQEEIDTRIADIHTSLGSQAAFEAWLVENLYSLDSFRSALEEEILAAQMVASITGAVSRNSEQVHARHILVATQDEADSLRTRILAGEDFGEIAREFSIDASTRPAGGDIGWFPEGYLLWPEVDLAAFGLAPGELSQVIQTELGYHLVELLERGEHQLDYDAWLFVQEKAIQDWLTEQRELKDIQTFIET
jgi:parvulin-like peptidyl-prolyl isomerase